jgi:hypothetical protein
LLKKSQLLRTANAKLSLSSSFFTVLKGRHQPFLLESALIEKVNQEIRGKPTNSVNPFLKDS